MRIYEVTDRPTRPDPLVLGSSLPVRVKLSPNVIHVKAGTPLCPGTLGWEVARSGEPVVLFATNAGRGSELVNVARELVVQLHTRNLVPCARYKITDVDETGYPTFAPDGDGPYFAVTDDSVLLTPDV